MTLLSDQTLAHKLISKGSIAYIASFLIAPVWYLLRIIASNNMDVSDIGLFYSMIGLIGLLAAYNDLWLTEALQYFLPKYWIEKKYNHYKTIRIMTFGMQLVSWILIGWGLWLGADWLSIHYFESTQTSHILKVFSLYFVAINFLQALASVYTAFQDIFSDKLIETIRLYSVLLCTLVFTFLGSLSLTTFSYAWLWWLGIALVVSIFLCGVKYGKTLSMGNFILDKELIKTQLSYAFWVFLWLNAGTLLGQIDQQIVIVFLGAADAGYFSNYLSLFSIYGIFLWPLMWLIFPITTELITKNHTQKIILFIQILYKYFSVFSISVIWFFVALGPIISATLYGQQFIYSGTLLQYGAPFIIFNMLIVINFWFLAGMGKAKERVFVIVAGLLINIVMNMVSILVFKGWLYGVVLATGMSWIVMFWMSLSIIRKAYVIIYNRWFMVRNLLLVSILSYVLWYTAWYMDFTDRMLSFVHLAGMGIAYYCIIAAFNYKNIVSLWRECKSLWFVKK